MLIVECVQVSADVNNCEFVDVQFTMILLSDLPDCRRDWQADALQVMIADSMGLTYIQTAEAGLKKRRCVTKCRHVKHYWLCWVLCSTRSAASYHCMLTPSQGQGILHMAAAYAAAACSGHIWGSWTVHARFNATNEVDELRFSAWKRTSNKCNVVCRSEFIHFYNDAWLRQIGAWCLRSGAVFELQYLNFSQ